MSTKDEIFDYVMNSPENTNPAVLGSMLSVLENSNRDAVAGAFLEGTVKEISNNEITSVIPVACQGLKSLTKIDLPKVKTIGKDAFNVCKALVDVNIPECTVIEEFAFAGCNSLIKIDLPKIETIKYGGFEDCSSLAEVNLPEFTTAVDSTFSKCSSLIKINLPKLTEVCKAMFYRSGLKIIDLAVATGIGSMAFQSCTNLDTIILRSNILCELKDNPYAILSGTPFASAGTGGTLYVPQTLISDYQSAEGWSTFLGFANNKILPIEDSEFA